MMDDLHDHCLPGNVWDLFHKVWGQAKASPEYDKEVFLQLEVKLIQLQKIARARAIDPECSQVLNSLHRVGMTTDELLAEILKQ